MSIAVDAMGGDHAPRAVVHGAAMAVQNYPEISVVLVGDEQQLRREISLLPKELLGFSSKLKLEEAKEIIDMDEHPAHAVRTKTDSSIVVCCNLVKQATATAIVSAGNSGATLAAALLILGRIEGIARPAIGTFMPTATGKTLMLDVGANPDCKSEWLVQFAFMGDAYAKTTMQKSKPRIGILSNGEEAEKGSSLVQAASKLLAEQPLNFVGNIESKQLFAGECDVLVTDGFSGNLLLKSSAGAAEFLFSTLKKAAKRNWQVKLGALLLKPTLRKLYNQADYRKTGGALLLGVKAEIVIAHGRSDAVAVMNAIKVAHQATEQKVSKLIAQKVKEFTA